MYRNTKNYENQQKMVFEGVGEYGIPQIDYIIQSMRIPIIQLCEKL